MQDLLATTIRTFRVNLSRFDALVWTESEPSLWTTASGGVRTFDHDLWQSHVKAQRQRGSSGRGPPNEALSSRLDEHARGSST